MQIKETRIKIIKSQQSTSKSNKNTNPHHCVEPSQKNAALKKKHTREYWEAASDIEEITLQIVR